MSLFEGVRGERIRLVIFVVLCVLAALLTVQVIAAVLQLRYIGTGITPTNTIVVSGHGETLQIPDIATFSFSVVSDKPTVAEAQQDATAKANAITDYLAGTGVDKKDVQTSDYSVQPRYSYQSVCPQVNGSVICPPGRQTLTGYEVRQTTTVKVRNTNKAGDLLAGVGQKGATEVSGLTLGFDNPDAAQQAARDKAIANAKQKGEALAKSLGVSLVRVVSFSENGNNPRYPVAYDMMAGKGAASAPVAPTISVGQNKVTSDVSVTYEIR